MGESDGYVVFVRSVGRGGNEHREVENPIGSWNSYEEAREVKRLLPHGEDTWVIRFVGESGGGD
jgi:hypothetical protein